MIDEHKKEYETFIECNRGTYAFVSLISSLNEHLIKNNTLSQKSSTKEQVEALSQYFNTLIDYLCNMPSDDQSRILATKGQGAETLWLRMYQNAIHKQIPLYNPDGLETWLETQDQDLQQEGQKCGREIEKLVKSRILNKLEELYGNVWENKVMKIKGKCFQRIDENDDIENQDWTDYMEWTDFKEIIDSNWGISKEGDDSFITFEKEFSIQTSESFRTKTDKLKWINDLISFSKAWTTTKGKLLSRADVDEMKHILQSLEPTEEYNDW